MNIKRPKLDNHLLQVADDLENGSLTLEDLYLEQLLVDSLEMRAGNFEDVETDAQYFVESDANLFPVSTFAFTQNVMAEIHAIAAEEKVAQTAKQTAEQKAEETATATQKSGITRITNTSGVFGKSSNAPEFGFKLGQNFGATSFASVKHEEPANNPASHPPKETSQPTVGSDLGSGTGTEANTAVKKKDSIFNFSNLLATVIAFSITFFAINYYNKQDSSFTMAANQPVQQEQLLAPTNTNQLPIINSSMVASSARSSKVSFAGFKPKKLKDELSYISLRVENSDDIKTLEKSQSVNLTLLLINYELQKRLIGNQN